MDLSVNDWAAIVTAATSLAVALVSGIVALVKSHQVKQALDNARQRETYIICPHCHKKAALSEIDFRLPSGQLDNDLNGVPDDLQ